MREIKYRGYSKNFKKMFDYELLKSASEGMVKICNMFTERAKIDSIPIEKGLFIPTEDTDMTLMQYTGLKDNKGKEIYEGDILDTKVSVIVIKYGEFADLAFGYEGFGWYIEDITNDFNIGLYDLSEYEIIGNIYENPELLEVK